MRFLFFMVTTKGCDGGGFGGFWGGGWGMSPFVQAFYI